MKTKIQQAAYDVMNSGTLDELDVAIDMNNKQHADFVEAASQAGYELCEYDDGITFFEFASEVADNEEHS